MACPAGSTSHETRQALEGRYDLEPRGLINVKGMGKIRTAFLTGRKDGARPELLEYEQLVGSNAMLQPP